MGKVSSLDVFRPKCSQASQSNQTTADRRVAGAVRRLGLDPAPSAPAANRTGWVVTQPTILDWFDARYHVDKNDVLYQFRMTNTYNTLFLDLGPNSQNLIK